MTALSVQYLLWLCFLCAVSYVESHTYALGDCPKVEPVENFNLDKFLGHWYVIQKFSTASSCWTYDFVKNSTDGSLKVIQSRDHVILDTVGLDNTYRYTGTLDVPDDSRPAFMRVSFPLSVAGKADYVVFATDYDNYAAVYSCQRVLFGHRRSASILSRKPQLDLPYVNKIRSKLESFGVDPHDFSIVSHDDCHYITRDSLLNFGVGPDTLSFPSVTGVIKDAGHAIGTGIEKAADGATKIFNRVSTGSQTEQSTNSQDPKRETEPESPTGSKDPKKDVEWLFP